MRGVDLKLTEQQAADSIAYEAREMIRQLRERAHGLTEQLDAAQRVEGPITAVIPRAAFAGVVDVETSTDAPPGWLLSVQIAHGYGGSIVVNQPIRRGRYRVVVLIDQVDGE